MAGAVRNRALLVVVSTNQLLWLPSLLGPVEMLVAKPGTLTAPASSPTVTMFVERVKLGASLTGSTVSRKEAVLVAEPSSAARSMRLVPKALAAGRRVSIQLVP